MRKKRFIFSLLFGLFVILLMVYSKASAYDMTTFTNEYHQSSIDGYDWGKEFVVLAFGFTMAYSVLAWFFNKT